MAEPHWKIDVLLAGTWRGATCTLLTQGKLRILVDTGLPHEGTMLVAQLHSRGIQPADIQMVVNTHLHVDHVMNNHLFPRAAIYATQQSYDWSLSMYSDVAHEHDWERLVLKYYPEIPDHQLARNSVAWLRKFALRWWDPVRLGERSRFRWLEQAQLPEGITTRLTSGHVPGHASLVVPDGTQLSVIAGDALLSHQHDEKVLTMIPCRLAQYESDRAFILSLGDRIIPGHDREFRARPLAPGMARDVVSADNGLDQDLKA